MEEEISTILSNQHLPKCTLECDVHENCSSKESPVVLGQSVCYIVGAVLINDNNEILLIQEAKPSCKGLWYLPAGRVEPDETLVDAVKREVLEEAGLIIEPTGLICVEENSGRWMRFMFAGKVTGGHLKTSDEADGESLQASWFDDVNNVQLRSRDILRVIQQAKSYYEKHNLKLDHRRLTILPLLTPHKVLFVRALIFAKSADHCVNLLQVKSSCTAGKNLPVSCFQLFHTIKEILQYIVDKCLTDECADSWDGDIAGLLCVEHNGMSQSGYDGLCLTVLSNLQCKDSQVGFGLPPVKENQAQWCKLSDNTAFSNFYDIEEQKKLCIPILSL